MLTTQITVNLDSKTAERFNRLMALSDDKNALFDSFIEYYKKKAELEMNAIGLDLREFKNKYTMESPVFYEKFKNGLLGDSKYFILWAGIFEMWDGYKRKIAGLL